MFTIDWAVEGIESPLNDERSEQQSYGGCDSVCKT